MQGLGGKLKRYLITGFIVVAPISITVFLAWWFVSMVDHLLSPVVYTFLGRHVPGLGLIAAMILLTVAGWLGTNLTGQHILEWTEEMFLRLPAVNWLYRTIKQLTEVFSPGGKVQFKSVVMVEYPRPGVYQLGFATGRTVYRHPDGREEKLYAVYIATNHLYIGDLLLVPEDKVTRTRMLLQDGVQTFLSAGATIPDRIEARPKQIP